MGFEPTLFAVPVNRILSLSLHACATDMMPPATRRFNLFRKIHSGVVGDLMSDALKSTPMIAVTGTSLPRSITGARRT